MHYFTVVPMLRHGFLLLCMIGILTGPALSQELTEDQILQPDKACNTSEKD